MDLIKHALILFTTLVLISCGGDSGSSDLTEIIFPELLPEVNPNLSQENQSGIWMVYRVTTENSEFTNGDGEIVTSKKEIIANELGTIIFDDEYDYYGNYLNCSSDYFRLDNDYKIQLANDQGYTELYRDDKNEEHGSSGRITVSYLSSQKIHGKGWKTHYYWIDGIKTGFHQEIEFFAVKVSDEDNFLLSDDLDYSSTVNSEVVSFDENLFYSGMCLGLQEHNTSFKEEGAEAGSYKFQYFQHHLDFDHNFEIYDGKSSNSEKYEAGNNQVIGVLQAYNYIDNYCISSDHECVNKYDFQSEILQNDSSGISFTAKLTGNEGLNNEVYIDAEVSVIIYPFEATSDSQ